MFLVALPNFAKRTCGTESRLSKLRILACPVPEVVISTRDLAQLRRRSEPARDELSSSAGAAHTTYEDAHTDSARVAHLNGSGPKEDIELGVVSIWRDLLGADHVGVEDNFFELGGHSLMGTQILARLRARFGVDLPLRAVFEFQTPHAIAAAIRGKLNLNHDSEQMISVAREEIDI